MKHVNDQLHMDDNAPANTLDTFLPPNLFFLYLYIHLNEYVHALLEGWCSVHMNSENFHKEQLIHSIRELVMSGADQVGRKGVPILYIAQWCLYPKFVSSMLVRLT